MVSATEKADGHIYEVDFKKASAIIMGSEDIGIHPSLLKLSDCQAKLPMSGTIASLNVAVMVTVSDADKRLSESVSVRVTVGEVCEYKNPEQRL